MKNHGHALIRAAGTLALAALLVVPHASSAQEPDQPAMPGPPGAKASAKPSPVPSRTTRTPPGLPINVRVDVKITDERPGLAPITKMLGVTVADGESGMVRSTTEATFGGQAQFRSVPLNVDARPRLEGNRIRLRLSLEYKFVDPADGKAATHHVSEHLSLMLESGRTVRAAESADPLTDRKVSLDVTATVLK